MNQAGTTNGSLKPQVRCAIYTRKSTDEGLDQEFNSLDAQREAAEAYVESQKHEGWTALPRRYDDGGYSGGNMERPGLQKLLGDIEAGRVDCVVVYKVDRLSRSLMDFAKLMAAFDEHSVSFVSVTQHFNTTTSMGRLTLNILLSFAQFEREIIGERIRDKIAAEKRKGKHTGGMPILGYDLDREHKRLVVNDIEAGLVCRIFKRFVQLRSPLQVARELNAEGHRTKTWTLLNGKVRHGVPWNKHHVSRVLNNRKYIGQVEHKGQVYPGEHEAIVPQRLWDEAHRILAENCRSRARRHQRKAPALLAGVIRCGHCGKGMGTTFTNKNGKRYQYYLCVHAAKNGYDTCPVRSVAAGVAEEAVVAQLRHVFRTPEIVAATFRAAKTKEVEGRERLEHEQEELEGRLRVLRRIARDLKRSGEGDAAAAELQRASDEAAGVERRVQELASELAAIRSQAVTEHDVIDALRKLDPVWEELFPAEQQRIIQLLVQEVVVTPEGLDVKVRADGLHSLVGELRDAATVVEARKEPR